MFESLGKPGVDLAARIKAKVSAGGAKDNPIGGENAEILPAKHGMYRPRARRRTVELTCSS